jgi:hypothetical protein
LRIITAPVVFALAGLIWLLSKAVNAWPERWQ